jgi:hypothetical protein
MQPATAGGVGLIQPHRKVSYRTSSPGLRLPDPKLVVSNEEARRIPDQRRTWPEADVVSTLLGFDTHVDDPSTGTRQSNQLLENLT